MLDQPDMKQKPTVLAELPSRLHHHAFVVKDQEVNRHFFEDILGMPLVATWCERTYHQDFGCEFDYCHTFFALADGGALAFLPIRRQRDLRESQGGPAAERRRLVACRAQSLAEELRRIACPGESA